MITSDQRRSVLSIDPGIYHTGTAIISNTSENICLDFVDTINTDNRMHAFKDVAHMYGQRYARIKIICEQILKLIEHYEPDMIISETRYMGKFPQAGLVLAELISCIVNTINVSTNNIPFTLIEPNVVKKSIGVKGNSGDKKDMLNAIVALGINHHKSIIVDSLDEHSIDSIAIGLYGIKTFSFN